MAVERKRLIAEDYDYLLPDHWILHLISEDNGVWRIIHEYYVKRVVELVVNSGAKTVLEVGCGDGYNCGQLIKAGLQNVVGIDWSRNGIEHAQRMVPDAQFVCCDITDTEFKRAFPTPFDAIIFVEVLEHIPPENCVQALRNITHFLKPGGRLFLTTPSVNLPNNNPKHYRHFDENTLRNLIAEAGDLVIDSIEGYGDIHIENQHYQIARWINNKYYCIKPLLKQLQSRYQRLCSSPTSLEVCTGFIVSMQKVATNSMWDS